MKFLGNPLILALISAVLLSLGWPTEGYPILLFIAFVPLLLAEYKIRHNQKKKQGTKLFFIFLVASLMWYIYTTWWLFYSTTFGAIMALSYYSTCVAVVFFLYHKVALRCSQHLSLIFFITLYISYEKLNLNWEVSWPWLNPGNGFSEYPAWVQWYEYTGVFGGTFWVLLVNAYIFSAIIFYRKYRNRRILFRKFSIAVLFVAIPIAISGVMYINYEEKQEPVNIILLQPNMDPYEEKYQMTDQKVQALLKSLSESSIDEDTDVIVAPETVSPRLVDVSRIDKSYQTKFARDIISQCPNVSFVLGIQLVNYNVLPNEMKYSFFINETERVNVYNSGVFIDLTNSPQIYNKSKPVVGVEHFPYKDILEPILGDLMLNLGGAMVMITPQEEREIFVTKDSIKMAPIICYESIYGEFMTDYIRKGAEFFVVMTNDGWWKNTQGHKQLLGYARLRAIAMRRSMARSANTGVSAFINQRGDLEKTLPYGFKGTLKGTVNRNDKITFYTKYGDIIARVSRFVVVLILILSLIKKKLQSV